MTSVDDAIARAATALLAAQQLDGSWNAVEDMEPTATATQLVLDFFLGRLNARDAREGARFLATRQLADGSFPAYPHGAASSLSVTGLCVAALDVASGHADAAGRRASERARAWLDAHGGVDAVVARMYSDSDQTAVYLAMAGLADADALPNPELIASLVPPMLDAMQLKINAGVIMGLFAMGFITRYLRKQKRGILGSFDPLWPVHEAEALACRKYMKQFQNPNGNWDGNTVQSALYVAGLFASGLTTKSSMLRIAIEWLDAQKRYDKDGMHMRVFTCENWMTSFSLRALLRAGVDREDPRIDRALRYLVSAQITTDMPAVDQRQRGVQRSGGWAFQPTNPTMPDSDDTGCVLAALGIALKRDDIIDSLDPGLAPLLTGVSDDTKELITSSTNDLIERAVDIAVPQLLGMQAPSGGFSAFVWNLGNKAPGPMYTKPLALPQNLIEQIRFFASPPVELADPPVEDITGRVLSGLGAVGYKSGAPEVERALAFLEAQRAPNGVWWGRWLVNYLAGTASIVSGVAAVHAKRETLPPWFAPAVQWLLDHQNDDGGFGETPLSYADASQAGRGPSMPPLTAIVLTALLDARAYENKEQRPAVERAVAYLLQTQEADGFWPNNGWLQVMLPPDQFYEYLGERMCRPLEALALYRAHKAQAEHPIPATTRLLPLTPPTVPFPITDARIPGDWPSVPVRMLRDYADPVADDVIASVFKNGQQQALSDLMATLVRSDDPIPTGLPPVAYDYFKNTEVMPAFADQGLLRIAEEIFVNDGWVVALGLFTSSLPQAYCAKNGARVLLKTGGMRGNTRRRILETAQFVFDVLNVGAFTGTGRGVRSAQKVRLMHATIRHLTLLEGEWDSKSWGVPLNQEDLAGTLMTFSVVVLDVFESVGVRLSDEQQIAYLHLWRVVGHFLGVDARLFPVDPADGRALMSAIRDDQWQSSVEGAQLGQALVSCMDDYLPGQAFLRLPTALIRRIAGDQVADLLRLPHTALLGELLTAASGVDDVLASLIHISGPTQAILRRLTTAMMEALINVQRDGKQTAFRIPVELVRGWNDSD